MFNVVNITSYTDAEKTELYCIFQYSVKLSLTLYVLTFTGRTLGEV